MKSCPIGSCDEAIPDERVMCRGHWRLVSEDLQKAVWRAFHRYQRRPGNLQVIGQLREAQGAAITHVEARLSRPQSLSQTSN